MTTYTELKMMWAALSKLSKETDVVDGKKRLRLARFVDMAMPALSSYEKMEQEAWTKFGAQPESQGANVFLLFKSPDDRQKCQTHLSELGAMEVEGLPTLPTFTEDEVCNSTLSAAEMQSILKLIDSADAEAA